MDRFEGEFLDNFNVNRQDLHSSMDRFEDYAEMAIRTANKHLHSSMDRFEGHYFSIPFLLRSEFTFQYG